MYRGAPVCFMAAMMFFMANINLDVKKFYGGNYTISWWLFHDD